MKPEFEYAVPVYHVSNLEEAASFFVAIGFELEWSWGEPVRYAGRYSRHLRPRNLRWK